MAIADSKKRYWGIVAPIMSADVLAQSAKQQEDMGLEGTFAAQVYGPPFIPLAAAATTTHRLLLASGIALAFVRSPFETAMAAMDLDRISGGRFILGLGSSIRTWSEGFFGMPYGKPVEHMREAVEVIRLIIAKSHTGELKNYQGKYYNLDFSELQEVLPPVRTDLPIWLAGTRGPMIQLAAEIADGIMGHPIWSVKWATATVPDHLKKGLARGGKQRTDVHVNYWFWVTPNNDVQQSVEDARACVAFFAGMEQYEEYFAAHGFRTECKHLQEGVKHRDYRSVAHLVPDEMASTFVVTGTPSDVRRKIDPVWEVADSVCLIPPILSLGPEQAGQYFATIAETFYS
jgi:probable F420-dependent oxidoreductase